MDRRLIGKVCVDAVWVPLDLFNHAVLAVETVRYLEGGIADEHRACFRGVVDGTVCDTRMMEIDGKRGCSACVRSYYESGRESRCCR